MAPHSMVFESSIVYDKKIYIDGILDREIDAYPTENHVGGSGAIKYGFLGDGSEAHLIMVVGMLYIRHHGRGPFSQSCPLCC